MLPFVLLTSLVLLLAILILADHERLEQADRLAGLREVYYQGLRQQETPGADVCATTCGIT